MAHSLGRDLTMEFSSEGRSLLAKRNADRVEHEAASRVGKKAGPKEAAFSRQLPEGAAQLYDLKHRQRRTNIKRTGEELHNDDRGGKRPEADFAL